MISGIRNMRATWYTAYLTDGNICVCYGIDHQGALFLLASAYQQADRVEDALEILAELHEEDPENGVVALGLATTIVEWDKADDEALEEVLAATEPALDNENAVETGLLLCRAKALRRLGLFDAARKIISLAMRRKKGRPEEVFLALRYERALCYQQEGHIKQMQKEFEKIYAIDTDFKDVKERVHRQV
jgi:tetratricopeptide (TPR) repeat protein